jgi:hypothetical protein
MSLVCSILHQAFANVKPSRNFARRRVICSLAHLALAISAQTTVDHSSDHAADGAAVSLIYCLQKDPSLVSLEDQGSAMKELADLCRTLLKECRRSPGHWTHEVACLLVASELCCLAKWLGKDTPFPVSKVKHSLGLSWGTISNVVLAMLPRTTALSIFSRFEKLKENLGQSLGRLSATVPMRVAANHDELRMLAANDPDYLLYAQLGDLVSELRLLKRCGESSNSKARHLACWRTANAICTESLGMIVFLIPQILSCLEFDNTQLVEDALLSRIDPNDVPLAVTVICAARCWQPIGRQARRGGRVGERILEKVHDPDLCLRHLKLFDTLVEMADHISGTEATGFRALTIRQCIEALRDLFFMPDSIHQLRLPGFPELRIFDVDGKDLPSEHTPTFAVTFYFRQTNHSEVKSKTFTVSRQDSQWPVLASQLLEMSDGILRESSIIGAVGRRTIIAISPNCCLAEYIPGSMFPDVLSKRYSAGLVEFLSHSPSDV